MKRNPKEKHRTVSKPQAKILARLVNGWRLSDVPRSFRQFSRVCDEKLDIAQFRGLLNQGWIEPDGDIPHQWRISERGREALRRSDVPLCH
jgi:hypothetical protein